MKEFPTNFGFSVSNNTRAQREKDKNGIHNFKCFGERHKEAKFLEFFSTHGNLYRTSIEAVKVVADQGKANVAYCDICSSYYS